MMDFVDIAMFKICVMTEMEWINEDTDMIDFEQVNV